MGYTLVNIGTGVTLTAGATPLQLDLRVRNLFDTAHAPQLSRIKTNAPLPGMGRALQIAVRAAFGH
jgi:outer membrane receptor protein involved in Fe transport